jgi:acetylornithine deacetylase/succinyl-diaminopimelate desuccinylase-like protein
MPFTYDLSEATTLTRALVAIKSYPGAEHACQQAVAEWFVRHGMTPEIWQTSAAPNVIVKIHNGDGPTMLLNGHVDTVWLPRDGTAIRGKVDWMATGCMASVHVT